MKHVVCAASSVRIVLVTGFGAFPGAHTNPTAAILKRLERQMPRLARLGIELRCHLLPVVYAEVEPALRRLAEQYRPMAVLHLGLAGRRQAVSIETRALNRAGPLHPDAARRLPQSQILAAGLPQSLVATYPAAEILAAVRRSGVSARRSIDAGDYVCNATLFASLAGRIAPQVGFMHVPRPRAGRLTIDDLTYAAIATVLVMGRPNRAHPPVASPRAPRRDDAPGSRPPH